IAGAAGPSECRPSARTSTSPMTAACRRRPATAACSSSSARTSMRTRSAAVPSAPSNRPETPRPRAVPESNDCFTTYDFTAESARSGRASLERRRWGGGAGGRWLSGLGQAGQLRGGEADVLFGQLRGVLAAPGDDGGRDLTVLRLQSGHQGLLVVDPVEGREDRSAQGRADRGGEVGEELVARRLS